MNGRKKHSRRLRRQAQVAAFAVIGLVGLGLPASSVGAQNAGVTVSEDVSFESHFEPFDELPEVEIPPRAVDISEIEPPIEIEEPEPEITANGRSLGRGMASYYGRKFHGRRTANGERFDMNALTAAHKTLPFGSKVRVTNTANGKSVVVRINDRGPFIRGRTIDLSRSAAQKIGLISRGHGSVELELL